MHLLGNVLCDLGQVMYFLTNASPPKLLDIATSNFVLVHVTHLVTCLKSVVR